MYHTEGINDVRRHTQMMPSFIVKKLVCSSKILLAAVITTFLGLCPASAQEHCLLGSASERLINTCLIESLMSGRTSYATAEALDQRLKRVGVKEGLGLGFRFPFSHLVFDLEIRPIVEYSRDINGGNPAGPMEVGPFVFQLDPALEMKSGMAFGGAIGANGRYIYGRNRYINLGIEAGGAFNLDHGIGYEFASVNICAMNHITQRWFLDVCGFASGVVKSINGSTQKKLALTVSNIQRSAGGSDLEFSGTFAHDFSAELGQDQVAFKISGLSHETLYWSSEVTMGERIRDRMAMRGSLSANFGFLLKQRPLDISFSVSVADGGNLFGIQRSEVSRSILVKYPVWKDVKIIIGYGTTNSTIDFFDVRNPTIGLQAGSIQF